MGAAYGYAMVSISGVWTAMVIVFQVDWLSRFTPVFAEVVEGGGSIVSKGMVELSFLLKVWVRVGWSCRFY